MQKVLTKIQEKVKAIGAGLFLEYKTNANEVIELKDWSIVYFYKKCTAKS